MKSVLNSNSNLSYLKLHENLKATKQAPLLMEIIQLLLHNYKIDNSKMYTQNALLNKLCKINGSIYLQEKLCLFFFLFFLFLKDPAKAHAGDLNFKNPKVIVYKFVTTIFHALSFSKH